MCFSYEDEELGSDRAGRPVIDHMDLSIRPGETIALVGPSGGGKTTTCSLLPRFYDVTSGSITIDGQDVRSVTQQSLRQAIGLVQQDVYLFDGTIGENIAYGRPGATQEEIVEAARRANIHEFIETLPAGYDTVVGERGSRLSGGQKQRVAIARVFLKNPAILILDEATSALDNESEEAVQESLERLARDRTTIIIAHRLSTIKNADEIATVERGRVVERGTHDELLAPQRHVCSLLSNAVRRRSRAVTGFRREHDGEGIQARARRGRGAFLKNRCIGCRALQAQRACCRPAFRRGPLGFEGGELHLAHWASRSLRALSSSWWACR